MIIKAEIIAVGTELLMGQIANTNAQFLSQKLPAVGIGVYYHCVVGDNPQRLKEVLTCAISRSDVIILTGGLGPTQDDLTKETVAAILGLEMVYDAESSRVIEEFFKQLKRDMVPSNLKQAYFPQGAKILNNDKGTAPGCIVETEKNMIVMLPGPPDEMVPMYEKCVEPYFSNKSDIKLVSAYIKIIGMGESRVEDKLMPLINNQKNPTFATYAKMGDCTLRITASSERTKEANNILNKAVADVREILGANIYSISGEEPEEVIINKYINEGKTIAVAESCTGGLLFERLTTVPGSSEVMGYGIVTYSNEAKHKLLGVETDTLDKFGAVSKETVTQMCLGLKNISQASTCIAISGIAGPGGGTDDKPVGLVYIGILRSGGNSNILDESEDADGMVKCIECRFNGNRNRIRTLAVAKVMEELLLN